MRMSEGKETWHRLLAWDRGQTASERLAAILLASDSFQNVDPSHPLGGKDGLKDMVLSYNGAKWIGAVYFPRGQQEFASIKEKFLHDLDGVVPNGASGLVFFTNQEIRLGERKILSELNAKIDIQIYHLERICALLNTPSNYGTRMDFLDIEMTKEEQVAFFATQTQTIIEFRSALDRLTVDLAGFKCAHQIGTAKPVVKDCETSVENDYDESDDEEYYEKPRSLDEVSDACEEFLDKIWFNRHLSLRYRVEHEGEAIAPEIWQGALKSAQRVIDKYGELNLGPYSDFEWGMLNGKLSALRWVLGDEWDMLDT